MLGRVAGGVFGGQDHPSDVNRVAVFEPFVRETVLRTAFGAHADFGRPGAIGQFETSGHQIRVTDSKLDASRHKAGIATSPRPG